MSTHYESLSQADAYRDAFGVEAPAASERNMTPRKSGFFIRSVAVAADAATEQQEPSASDTPPAPAPPARELVAAQWGLVPHWVKSASDGRLRALKLVNARSETVSTAQAFRDAWLNGQRCIVPMAAFSRMTTATARPCPRASRASTASPWAWPACGRSGRADGEVLLSYTLLTVNANSHALLHRYQQPGAEKRMPAILNEGAYDAWLNARVEKAREFMRQYPSNWLTANPWSERPTSGLQG